MTTEYVLCCGLCGWIFMGHLLDSELTLLLKLIEAICNQPVLPTRQVGSGRSSFGKSASL